MAHPSAERRLCPTRADGAETLIAHWIAPKKCQDRQRDNYHKCFICVHKNGAAPYVPEPRRQVVRTEKAEARAGAPDRRTVSSRV